jgi:hypothetical protein
MQRPTNLIASAFGAALLAACVGGPGDLTAYDGYYENRPGRLESPGKRREPPPDDREIAVSNESPGLGGIEPSPSQGSPGTGAGGPLVCAGKYDCLVHTGTRTDDDDLTLREVNGACTINGQIVMSPNGQLLVGGRAVGTWSGGGTTFTFSITIETRTLSGTCRARTDQSGEPEPEPTQTTPSPGQ